jgi:hypothetical protein
MNCEIREMTRKDKDSELINFRVFHGVQIFMPEVSLLFFSYDYGL